MSYPLTTGTHYLISASDGLADDPYTDEHGWAAFWCAQEVHWLATAWGNVLERAKLRRQRRYAIYQGQRAVAKLLGGLRKRMAMERGPMQGA